MTTEIAQTSHVDVSNSVTVVVVTPILSAAAAWVCDASDISGSGTGTITAVAAAVPPLGALVLHRLRTTPHERATAIAEDDMGMNPFVLVFALGSFLALADSLLGGAIGWVVGATVGATADLGATKDQQDELFRQGFGAGGPIAFLALATIALFAGRRAAHYAKKNKYLLLACGAAVYVAVRLLGISAAGGALKATGLGDAFLPWVLNYGVIGVVLTVFLFLGALWARRRHEAFMGERMLAQLSPADRAAALDLLRQEVTQPERR